MKKTFEITGTMPLFNGLQFDAMLTSVKDSTLRTKVRFVFYTEGDAETLTCGVLSNHEPFDLKEVSIPEAVRFADEFKCQAYYGLYGCGDTIQELCNHFNGGTMGSYRITLLPDQSIEVDDSIVCLSLDFFNGNYTIDSVYTGQHSYHHSHSVDFNKPITPYRNYKIGVELEVEAKNDRDLEKIRKARSNWFVMERDGSLNDRGIEFVTIPLRPEDAKSDDLWSGLLNFLAPRAVSWDSSRCGLHVHIGRAILGRTEEKRSESLGKMLYLYHHHLKETAFNTKVYGRSAGYSDCDGKVGLAKAVNILGADKTLTNADFVKAIDEELKSRGGSGRYFDINITNEKTIEFRRGRGSLKMDRIQAVIEYCEWICKYSVQVEWPDISFDNFVDYLKSNVAATSPLRQFLE